MTVSMKMFACVLGTFFTWAVDATGGILDSHLFFYDRYSDLAKCHRSKDRTAKADRLAAIAEATAYPRTIGLGSNAAH
jgi:hypothetical protein